MKIIIHGGLIETDDKTEIEQIQNALREIVTNASEYLKTHNAFETVIYAVTLLENNLLFDAGTGSALQADGKIRMSAAVCDGYNHTMSGVINIQDVKNPIQVAEKLMPKNDKILSGPEAIDFARKQGFEYYNPETEKQRKEFEKKKKSGKYGTVGCVVLDEDNRIAAATSTGGLGNELPGRVADTPTVAGNYAYRYCGVSCSGTGEDIVNNAVAAKIVTRVTDGFSLKDAFTKTIDEVNTTDGDAAGIGISSSGEMYYSASKARISHAWFDGEKIIVFE